MFASKQKPSGKTLQTSILAKSKMHSLEQDKFQHIGQYTLSNLEHDLKCVRWKRMKASCLQFVNTGNNRNRNTWRIYWNSTKRSRHEILMSDDSCLTDILSCSWEFEIYKTTIFGSNGAYAILTILQEEARTNKIRVWCFSPFLYSVLIFSIHSVHIQTQFFIKKHILEPIQISMPDSLHPLLSYRYLKWGKQRAREPPSLLCKYFMVWE